MLWLMVTMTGVAGLAVAWTEHDDASREFAHDVIEALRQAGISQLAASAYMWGDDRHESQLSKQLAGIAPLNAYLLVRLPPRFWFFMLKARAQRIGADMVEPGIIQELLSHLRALAPAKKDAA